ncbi:hypothetical protein, partial [Roseomonas sp. 18066]
VTRDVTSEATRDPEQSRAELNRAEQSGKEAFNNTSTSDLSADSQIQGDLTQTVNDAWDLNFGSCEHEPVVNGGPGCMQHDGSPAGDCKGCQRAAEREKGLVAS